MSCDGKKSAGLVSPESFGNWAIHAPFSARHERFEAFFRGHAYSPHRHDAYAIGRTLNGVQTFQYRRATQHGLPGSTIVIHPDELHDAEAGTGCGFRYRLVYIQPCLIQQALGGKPLPFVPGGLSDDPRLCAAVNAFLNRIDLPMDDLEEEDAIYDLAHALDHVSGTRSRHRPFDWVAAERARDFIHCSLDRDITLEDLVAASGRDKWSLSRDFRILYGTSPYRYVTQRRLTEVRILLRSGVSPSDAALACGFWDQSHMTHFFTRAYGLSPAKWTRMLNAT